MIMKKYNRIKAKNQGNSNKNEDSTECRNHNFTFAHPFLNDNIIKHSQETKHMQNFLFSFSGKPLTKS